MCRRNDRFAGYKMRLHGAADSILHWLESLKEVGDIAVNLSPCIKIYLGQALGTFLLVE